MNDDLRSITVDALSEALARVPAEHSVYTNAIGNLAILDKDGRYVGWIDFGDADERVKFL